MGTRPVFEELEGEIVELVGRERYDWFVDHVRSRPRAQILPHPARRRR